MVNGQDVNHYMFLCSFVIFFVKKKNLFIYKQSIEIEIEIEIKSFENYTIGF